MRPNLTLNYWPALCARLGPDRNSDIAPIPCSQLDPALAALLWRRPELPATGISSIFFFLGKAIEVRTPSHNSEPTAGLACDQTGSGKTVIRAGAGLGYENSIFNNNLFNRPGHLAQGLVLERSGTVFRRRSQPALTLPGRRGSHPRQTSILLFCWTADGNQWSIPVWPNCSQLYQAAGIGHGPCGEWRLHREHAVCQQAQRLMALTFSPPIIRRRARCR